jgi:hypothetical protein
LHRVEAMVCTSERVTVDALARAALERLAAHPGGADALCQWFGISLPLAQALLGNLRQQGWLTHDAAPARLTPAGVEVSQRGSAERRRHTRRVFHFAVPTGGGPAHFLALPPGLAAPCSPPAPDWRFHPDSLDSCVSAPTRWKQEHRFPEEVEQVCRLGAGRPGCDALPAWQQVILDRAECLRLAVTAGDRCLGFAMAAATWKPLRPEPVFSFTPDEAATVLGAALAVPDSAAWRAAWETCRRPLGLPPGEVSNFRPTPDGPRLTVTLPPAAVARARSAGADLWLLAGTGPFRCAAVPEFRAAS